MKIDKLLQMAGLVALMGAATGCADDALVQLSPETEQVNGVQGKTITLQASVPTDGSRVTYNEGESKMTMMWEEGDSFSVFKGMDAEKSTLFTIEDGAGTANGVFQGTPDVAYNEGDELYIIYPAVPETMSMQELVLDLSSQNGKLDADNQFMYAKCIYKNNALPALNFNHLTAIAKMKLEFPEGVSAIREIRLSDYMNTEWLSQYSQRTVNLSTGELTTCENSAVEYVITNDMMKVENQFLTVYAYLFADERFSVIIATDDQGKQYANAFNPRNLDRGKMYRVNAPMIPIVPFNGGKGTEQAPYEIANLAQWNSLSALVGINMANEDGMLYPFAHYKLTADIELSESDVMYPIGVSTNDMYFRGHFDGDNHQITGTLNLRGTNHDNMGLFPVVGWATISNLHLNATAGEIHDPSGSFGSIVGRMIQGNVINCSSTLDISLSKPWYVGGIVGFCVDQMFSTIEGCSYAGNLTATNGDSYVGGIVGELGFDGKVRACYATGSITSTNGYGGGIVGIMTGCSQAVGCWSTVNLTSSNNFGGIVGRMCNMDESSEEKMFIDYCYYQHAESYPLAGNIEGDNFRLGDNGSLGDDAQNYRPTADQIAKMNAGLKTCGSKFAFDQDGKPYLNITSSGGASGENFGNGGEF